MGDVIKRTGVFLQTAREILRKRDEERLKCPRCRGSGLLYLHSMWQRSTSNAPCLFCEGIGVMPVIGLRGYLIGRTEAMLSTKREIKTRSLGPDNKVHSSGRKSTKHSTRRQFKIPSLFLYNPLCAPIWLVEAQREASLVEASQPEAVEQATENRWHSDDASPVGLIGLDHAGWRYRHRFYARTRAPFSNPSPSSQSDSSVMDGPTAEDVLQASDFTGIREAVADSDSLRHPQRNLQGPIKRGKSSPRGPRSSRRPRNRIREKAEKEAEVRARRVQRPISEASLWNPLLRMCSSLVLSTASDPTELSIQEVPDNVAFAA